MITLTNVGSVFDGIGASKGLGFAIINFTSVTQLIFTVRYQKVGTGTLTWQLWNETDGSVIGVIDDTAAAADNKAHASTSPSPTKWTVCRNRSRLTKRNWRRWDHVPMRSSSVPLFDSASRVGSPTSVCVLSEAT
jgi:hypothetical protein